MTFTRTDPEQPFWKDEPNPYRPPTSPNVRLVERFSLWFIIIFRITWLAFFVGLPIFLALLYPVVWILVLAEIGFLLFVFIRYFAAWRKARGQLPVAEIQRLTKERTGADIIGSAVHTAGHPLLALNQPVVLALKGRELFIYNYNSPIPIDTINVEDIRDLQTVVFDDEQVPHVGIVDSTAQALQLTFEFRGVLTTCSFRRMYKVRAIGWYQAIQAARAQARP